MRNDYKRLGDYIRLVDVRNRELLVTKLLGVSISKEFMPSIANTIGTDMSAYKIVKQGQFAYGPVTSRNGDKVSIALLETEDEAIISQAYTVFEVIDKQKLIPEYLKMWFRRPEFDRYARFHSHGSAREVFDWDEMCNVMLPIPSLERQQEIVAEYETLTRRIRLNEQMISKLEETAQTIYHKMFVDGIDKENLPEGWRIGILEDIADITMGQSPNGDSYNNAGNGEIFYQGRTDYGVRYPAIRMYTTEPTRMAKLGDILLSVRAPVGDLNIAPADCCIGRGLAAIRSKIKCNSYIFYLLKTKESDFNISNDDGTVFGSITKCDLYNLQIMIP
ncbi:MAG: restriction endonuclease subunit S, partial [Prevotella sp.]|nr:restriction endonuclease subunit S [Prevotella sp.]